MTPAGKKFLVVLGYAVTLLLCYGLLSVPNNLAWPVTPKMPRLAPGTFLWHPK